MSSFGVLYQDAHGQQIYIFGYEIGKGYIGRYFPEISDDYPNGFYQITLGVTISGARSPGTSNVVYNGFLDYPDYAPTNNPDDFLCDEYQLSYNGHVYTISKEDLLQTTGSEISTNLLSVIRELYNNEGSGGNFDTAALGIYFSGYAVASEPSEPDTGTQKYLIADSSGHLVSFGGSIIAYNPQPPIIPTTGGILEVVENTSNGNWRSMQAPPVIINNKLYYQETYQSNLVEVDLALGEASSLGVFYTGHFWSNSWQVPGSNNFALCGSDGDVYTYNFATGTLTNDAWLNGAGATYNLQYCDYTSARPIEGYLYTIFVDGESVFFGQLDLANLTVSHLQPVPGGYDNLCFIWSGKISGTTTVRVYAISYEGLYYNKLYYTDDFAAGIWNEINIEGGSFDYDNYGLFYNVANDRFHAIDCGQVKTYANFSVNGLSVLESNEALEMAYLRLHVLDGIPYIFYEGDDGQPEIVYYDTTRQKFVSAISNNLRSADTSSMDGVIKSGNIIYMVNSSNVDPGTLRSLVGTCIDGVWSNLTYARVLKLTLP